MNSLKISVIAGCCTGYGGTETHVMDLCHNLRDEGWSVNPIIGPARTSSTIYTDDFDPKSAWKPKMGGQIFPTVLESLCISTS